MPRSTVAPLDGSIAQQLDDGLLERLAVPAVGFANVNAHQGTFAFQAFLLAVVGQRCSCPR